MTSSRNVVQTKDNGNCSNDGRNEIAGYAGVWIERERDSVTIPLNTESPPRGGSSLLCENFRRFLENFLILLKLS
jgi:hypothetical protein